MSSPNCFVSYVVLLASFAVAPIAAADTSPNGGCPEPFGQGGVSIFSSLGEEFLAFNASIDIGQLGPTAFEDEPAGGPGAGVDRLFFNFAAFALRLATVAEQFGLDGNEVLEKFSAASFELKEAGFLVLAFDSANESPTALTALSVVAFTDPFYGFDLVYRNQTDIEQQVGFQMPLNTDPLGAGATFSQAYLEIDLIDANQDGTATLSHAFARDGFLSANAFFDGSPFFADLVGAELGAELNGPTTSPVIFDTGVVAGPTIADGVTLTQLNPRIDFVISPGDEVRFRGVVSVSDTLGLLPNPLLVLNVADNGFTVPEPSAACLLISAAAFTLGLRRKGRLSANQED